MAVAHGSRDPRSAATISALVDQVRWLRPDLDVGVSPADPGIGVVLAPGLLPDKVTRLALSAYPQALLAAPLGPDDAVAELIADRYDNASGPLRAPNFRYPSGSPGQGRPDRAGHLCGYGTTC